MSVRRVVYSRRSDRPPATPVLSPNLAPDNLRPITDTGAETVFRNLIAWAYRKPMTPLLFITFVVLWCGLFAIPVKLGLLPEVASKIEASLHSIVVITSPAWLIFTSVERRQRFDRDLVFRRLLEAIVDQCAHPPFLRYEELDDDTPKLRPQAKARLILLHRKMMKLGLGSYVGDVHSTFRKAFAETEAQSAQNAFEQIRALRGRIAAHDHFRWGEGEQYGYYPYRYFDPPIAQIGEYFNCGVGDQLIIQLDGLWALDPSNEETTVTTIRTFCSTWIAEHGKRAEQFTSFVERFARRLRA